MFRRFGSATCRALALAVSVGSLAFAVPVGAQTSTAKPPVAKAPAAAKAPSAKAPATQGATSGQANDVEYTKKIKEVLTDPRISTELVDHLPASATVPTPLKFLGHIIGQPGELDHAKEIHAYLEAVAKASGGRAKFWKIGKTEEGRDIVVLAIADAATLAQLDKYKGMLNQLTDPRKTTEAQAKALIKTAKPIYWAISGMHSPETGGPEMLMELAYRLVVENSPIINHIRNNVITFITPVLEVDGREKTVDNFYWNKKFGSTIGRLPLMYWGKYVQHDNNRDGMGQFLELTKATTKTFLEWTPTVLHDLHEAQTYLYASTGSGPYNEELDPIVVDEWWLLAKNDVMEMTKRGVPGVWTYGYYDGWTPNYMFFIANTHNSIGRFYEVESYGPNNRTVNAGATTTSREWFRPNPPLPQIAWGPRANTNIQESAIIFALDRVAKDKEMFLENYWLKNKRAVDRGRKGPVYGWVIPAGQQQRENVAEAVNELKLQGLEFNRAAADYKAGPVQIKAGDYIIRGDQPYRTLADMYFSLQSFAPGNPSPYDDTGWTFPMMRNLVVTAIGDSGMLKLAMTPIKGDVTAPGGILGTGDVVIVDQSGDNTLVQFRFKFPNVKMSAAEVAFDAGGHHFNAGSFIIPAANRLALDPALKTLGLQAYAVATAPTVAAHELTVPRIGYAHSWSSTQDEGWVRAALDYYKVPYTYFGETLLKDGGLRAKYDVILYPHGGGGGRGGGLGGATITANKVPYKSTPEFPSLGFPDSTDDVGGGLGADGLKALYEFVQQGGTLITEGGTSSLFTNVNLTPGVTVEGAQGLVADGTILRGVISDKTSPIVYGYPDHDVPVYFNARPVFNVGQPAVAFAGTGGRGTWQNITPMATRENLSGWDPSNIGFAYGKTSANEAPAVAIRGGRGGGGGGGRGGGGGAGIPPDSAAAAALAAGGRAGGGGGRGGGRGGRGGGGGGGGGAVPDGITPDPNSTPRVVMSFPANPNDILLSGVLQGGELLVKRAQVIDQSIGKGHMVMFAIRPFWRWQTQGTFGLGFNAIMNWNHLDAGKK